MLTIIDFALLMKILLHWGVVFLGLVVVLVCAFFIEKRLKAPLEIIIKFLLSSLKWALVVAVFLMLFDLVAQLFQLEALLKYVDYAYALAMTFIVLRYLHQVIDGLYLWKFQQLKKRGQVATATGINGLKHIAKVLITLMLLINVMDQLNISYTGILTLAGAGSLAGAFAAKEIVQNIFGGLVIFFDQPFRVGDQITSVDKKIAGTVEHIGWRVTELVNLQKEPVMVPNGVFISMIIINRSKMKACLFNEVINLRYEDFAKIPLLIEAIKELIKLQNYVDLAQKYHVHLTAFASNSIDVMVRCTFADPSRDLFLQNKGRLLFEIGELVRRHGASMELPTISIDLDQGGDQQTA